MRIERQLQLTTVLPIFIVLVAVLIVNVVKVKNVSENYVEDLRVDMILKEKTNLQIQTGDKANLARLLLGKSLYNIDVLKSYADFVTDNGVNFNYTMYFNEPPLGTPPGPLTTTQKDPRDHNSAHSGWFKTGISTSPLRDSHATEFAEWSNLDNPFYPFYTSNNDYQNVYWGSQENGHYQSLPWTPTTFSSLSYLAYPSGTPTIGYDPRLRPWYYDAFTNESKTILTNPYNDALTGKVLITMARYVNATYPGDGVFGIDIYLNDLSIAITETKILENGKFYIISSTGTAVLYPDIDLDNVVQFVDLEFTNTEDKTAFASVWTDVLANDKFIGEFTKEDSQWIIATEKVIPDDLATNGGFFKDIDASGVQIPYIIASVVPVNDIEEVANAISNDANKNITIMLVIMCLVILVFIIITCYLVHKFSQRLTRPLIKLQRMMHNIQSGDLEQNLEVFNNEDFKTSSDVTALGIAFHNMYVLLRAGNTSFYKGDYNRAINDYDEAEKIIKTNKRAKGSIENNRGAAYHRMGQFQNAHKHYDNAIKIAKELSEDSNQSETDHKEHLAMYYNRRTNLAQLGVYIYEKDDHADKNVVINETNSVINDTLQYYQTTENMMGIGRILAVQGRLLTLQGDNNGSLNAYQSAYDTIRTFQISNPDKFEEQKFSLDYATLNLAEYYYNQYESTANPDMLTHCTGYLTEFNDRNIHRDIPENIIIKALTLQLNVAKSMGRSDIVDSLQSTTNDNPELKNAMNGSSMSLESKVVSFAIDVSGSMKGNMKNSNMSRFQAVYQSLLAIDQNILTPKDLVNITTFSNSLHPLTGNQYVTKDKFAHLFQYGVNEIDRNTGNLKIYNAWKVEGITAFYDVVYTLINDIYRFQKAGDNRTYNVMILTDGEDTQGLHNFNETKDTNFIHTDDIIKEVCSMIRKCRMNLMFFAIGNDYNKKYVNDMVAATNESSGCKGYHLKAGENIDSIMETFNEVGKIISGGEINVESIA